MKVQAFRVNNGRYMSKLETTIKGWLLIRV